MKLLALVLNASLCCVGSVVTQQGPYALFLQLFQAGTLRELA